MKPRIFKQIKWKRKQREKKKKEKEKKNLIGNLT